MLLIFINLWSRERKNSLNFKTAKMTNQNAFKFIFLSRGFGFGSPSDRRNVIKNWFYLINVFAHGLRKRGLKSLSSTKLLHFSRKMQSAFLDLRFLWCFHFPSRFWALTASSGKNFKSNDSFLRLPLRLRQQLPATDSEETKKQIEEERENDVNWDSRCFFFVNIAENIYWNISGGGWKFGNGYYSDIGLRQIERMKKIFSFHLKSFLRDWERKWENFIR